MASFAPRGGTGGGSMGFRATVFLRRKRLYERQHASVEEVRSESTVGTYTHQSERQRSRASFVTHAATTVRTGSAESQTEEATHRRVWRGAKSHHERARLLVWVQLHMMSAAGPLTNLPRRHIQLATEIVHSRQVDEVLPHSGHRRQRHFSAGSPAPPTACLAGTSSTPSCSALCPRAAKVWLAPCGPRPDKPNMKTTPELRCVMTELAINQV